MYSILKEIPERIGDAIRDKDGDLFARAHFSQGCCPNEGT